MKVGDKVKWNGKVAVGCVGIDEGIKDKIGTIVDIYPGDEFDFDVQFEGYRYEEDPEGEDVTDSFCEEELELV